MSLPGGKPSRGRYRDGRKRPTFARFIVLRRAARTLEDQTGEALGEASAAYALKAARSRPAIPPGDPPAAVSAPVLDAEGWKGWWGTEHGIVYPPRPREPVLETSPAEPLVWRSRGAIGGEAWETPEPFEARLAADVREKGGSEGDQTGTDVARTVASFRLRAANLRMLADDLGSVPVEWTLRDGGRIWDIVEALASWETNRYVDLRAVRRESARQRN